MQGVPGSGVVFRAINIADKMMRDLPQNTGLTIGEFIEYQ